MDVKEKREYLDRYVDESVDAIFKRGRIRHIWLSGSHMLQAFPLFEVELVEEVAAKLVNSEEKVNIAVNDAEFAKEQNFVNDLEEGFRLYGVERVRELYGKKRKVVVCYDAKKAASKRLDRGEKLKRAEVELSML